MPITFPNESPAYRAARDALLAREVELRRSLEAVAEARRALPPGGALPEDYTFATASGPAKLSELFGEKTTLVVYSYMFGPERKEPCPMCTPLLDGLDAIAPNVAQRLAFVVVAESPIERLLAFAKERGWSRLRLVSAAGTTFNRDYHGKTARGSDTTMLNVFQREGAGVRHFWGSELVYADSDPGQDMRAIDLLNPIFNMFDLTPEGRGDFYTKLRYG